MAVPFLTSDLLSPVRHGFFTRAGGASAGVFAGLNCGHGSSDQTEMVRINRARVAQAIGVPPEGLKTAEQVHSARVAVIGPEAENPARPADALVAAVPGVALGILTADCLPVLLADPEAGVVGAAHAGWRGALSGILEATVAAMEDLGARRTAIRAAIGPAISQTAYEVGPELYLEFVAADPEAARYFLDGADDRLHLDLPGYGLDRLRRAGVAQAEWIRRCTYGDPDRFYSYRRSVHRKEADYGRLISVVRTS